MYGLSAGLLDDCVTWDCICNTKATAQSCP